MKEVFTLRWIRKRNRSIGRKREDRREIYVTFNTFNSSYFPHLLSSSLHIRKKWIDSLDDDSLENRGEKREGRGKERKNYASIRENIVFSFHRGFEGLNRGQLRAIDKVSSGDARRLATRRKWCGSTSEPAHVHRRARHESWPPTESRTASPRASSRHALPSSFHRIVRRPSIIPLSAIPDNAFR